MKKVFPLLVGAAAIAGSAWYLYRKFGKPAMVVTGEFEDDEPIILAEDTTTEKTEDNAQ